MSQGYIDLCDRHPINGQSPLRHHNWTSGDAFQDCSDNHKDTLVNWRGGGYVCRCNVCHEAWFIKEPFGERSEVVKS